MRILPGLGDQEKALEERKRLLGISSEDLLLCRNRGRRRTPEKRALLKHIEARAKTRGSVPPFAANF